MKEKKLFSHFGKYEGIVRFLVVLIITHFFWKFTIIGEETGQSVSWFGYDISSWMVGWANQIALYTHHILTYFGDTLTLNVNTLRYSNNNAVSVVWGCNGVKQSFIFLCILLFSRGPISYKLPYAIIGVFCAQVFNLFRIVFLTKLIHLHPHLFDLFHEHILKYLFYILIFIIWMLWEDKIVPALNKEKISNTTDE